MAVSRSNNMRVTLMIIVVIGEFMATGINLTSTACQNEICQGEIITFRCIADGSRLVWTLNTRSEFSFDNLENTERIIPQPEEDSFATLLPRRDGLWESTYTLLNLPSSGNMTVACFDGSASEELIISVDTGSKSCSQKSVPTHRNAIIFLTSTAHQNVPCPEEFVTFLCIAHGSRLVWTLNNIDEFSFDNLGKVEKIVHKPLSESYATLLPRGNGSWKSTYSLLSLPSSGNMTVACFDGSASEELILSVIADIPSEVPTNVTSPEVPTNVTSPEVLTNVMSSSDSTVSVDTSEGENSKAVTGTISKMFLVGTFAVLKMITV